MSSPDGYLRILPDTFKDSWCATWRFCKDQNKIWLMSWDSSPKVLETTFKSSLVCYLKVLQKSGWFFEGSTRHLQRFFVCHVNVQSIKSSSIHVLRWPFLGSYIFIWLFLSSSRHLQRCSKMFNFGVKCAASCDAYCYVLYSFQFFNLIVVDALGGPDMVELYFSFGFVLAAMLSLCLWV